MDESKQENKKLEGRLKSRYNTKIGCKARHKMIQVTTMSVDTLGTTDSIDSVITNLQTDDIDIECIQETHNNRNGHMERERENYTIFFSGEKEQGVE